MIVGINHIGISVANIERSIEFYKQALGMQPLKQIGGFDPQYENGKYERILALTGAKGRVCTIEGAGNVRLELFEFEYPRPSGAPVGRPVSDYGISHFCIEVQDIDSQYRRVLAAGGTCHCPPLEFFGRIKATYARDPDGNVFELIQKLR